MTRHDVRQSRRHATRSPGVDRDLHWLGQSAAHFWASRTVAGLTVTSTWAATRFCLDVSAATSAVVASAVSHLQMTTMETVNSRNKPAVVLQCAMPLSTGDVCCSWVLVLLLLLSLVSRQRIATELVAVAVIFFYIYTSCHYREIELHTLQP